MMCRPLSWLVVRGRSPRLISDQLADRVAGKLDSLHHCLTCPTGLPFTVKVSDVDAFAIDPEPDAIEVDACLCGECLNFGGWGHGVSLSSWGKVSTLRRPHQSGSISLRLYQLETRTPVQGAYKSGGTLRALGGGSCRGSRGGPRGRAVASGGIEMVVLDKPFKGYTSKNVKIIDFCYNPLKRKDLKTPS